MPSVQTVSRTEKGRGNGGYVQSAIEPELHTVGDSPLDETLAQAISAAAYYRAEARGFEPGHELEDWVEAEREVTATNQAAGDMDH
ncbi:DUF2934 domain-containing protein [uncultured Lamprocystis sp.]|jgi:hypothetical protein|uniref:DUF2934 domain-containing protein n=1 Tax=uncultured Lamprocystis sp. TaxID=543132 RepID=UPI0025DBC39C|nr:DUF2934 domain-containing protein [uncultured Lamprocystis sp.]